MVDFNSLPLARETTRRLIEYYGWPNQYFTGADTSFALMSSDRLQGMGDIAAVGYTLENKIAPLSNYDDDSHHGVVYGTHIVIGTIALYYTRVNFLLDQVQHFFSEMEGEPNNGELPTDEEPDEQAAQEQWWGPVKRALSNRQQYDPLSNIPGSVSMQRRALTHEPFNLLISVGPAAMKSDLSKVLMSVSLASSSTKYANDDQPLIEEYQFIAKDVLDMSSAIAATDIVSDVEGLLDAMQTEPRPQGGQ